MINEQKNSESWPFLKKLQSQSITSLSFHKKTLRNTFIDWSLGNSTRVAHWGRLEVYPEGKTGEHCLIIGPRWPCGKAFRSRPDGLWFESRQRRKSSEFVAGKLPDAFP